MTTENVETEDRSGINIADKEDMLRRQLDAWGDVAIITSSIINTKNIELIKRLMVLVESIQRMLPKSHLYELDHNLATSVHRDIKKSLKRLEKNGMDWPYESRRDALDRVEKGIKEAFGGG